METYLRDLLYFWVVENIPFTYISNVRTDIGWDFAQEAMQTVKTSISLELDW